MFLIECQYCGNVDSNSANCCTKCGAPYATDLQKICINCRHKIIGKEVFCRICGISTVPQRTPKQAPPQPPQPQIQPIYIQQPIITNDCCNQPNKKQKKQKVYIERKRPSCLFDIFMLLITGGLWAIWMFIRR